jgi:predicted 2-oxoglutarate/Fe(II)-dependent dioxygenase YbiX
VERPEHVGRGAPRRGAGRRRRLIAPALIAGFLSAAECAELIAAIDAAHQAHAEIWGEGGFGVHPDSRRGTIAQLPAEAQVFVQDRLWESISQLEARFGCEITHLSGVTALVYARGDHFAAHSDGGGDDEAPPEVRRRRISLVVALNDGAREFTGGELEFYPGTTPAAAAREPPLVSVRSEPGLLVAFASNTIHRVAPVGDGRRYSLALWALAPDSSQSCVDP